MHEARELDGMVEVLEGNLQTSLKALNMNEAAKTATVLQALYLRQQLQFMRADHERTSARTLAAALESVSKAGRSLWNRHVIEEVKPASSST